jgi:formate hydrogenlyase subunit 4
MSGILIEYGGPFLALMKLAKSFMVFSLVFLATTLFLYVPAILDLSSLKQIGNDALALLLTATISWGVILATSIAILILAITIPRTILARLKIGQAFTYYMLLPLSLAISSIVLSVMNL